MRDKYEIQKTINGYTYKAVVINEQTASTEEKQINLYRPIPTKPQKILDRISAKLGPGMRAVLVKEVKPFSFTCSMDEEHFFKNAQKTIDNLVISTDQGPDEDQ